MVMHIRLWICRRSFEQMKEVAGRQLDLGCTKARLAESEPGKDSTVEQQACKDWQGH